MEKSSHIRHRQGQTLAVAAVAVAAAALVGSGCGAASETQAAETAPAPGCPERPRFATAGRRNGGPSWSPDGASIAFSSNRSGKDEVYVIDVATCVSRRVTTGGGRDPDWSPDGTRLVFVRDDFARNEPSLLVVDADGTKERLLLTRTLDNPSWSPRGDLIAFDAGTNDPREIWTIRPDGTGLRRVVPRRWHVTPTWSPDGGELAWGGGEDTERIWRMRLDGTGRRAVTPDDVFSGLDPSWSPDGSRIAYAGAGEDGGLTVFVVPAEGGRPVALLPDRNAGDPDWSPDEAQVAFTSFRGPSEDLYVVAANGAGPRALSVAPPGR